jgi:hypothetical protein
LGRQEIAKHTNGQGRLTLGAAAHLAITHRIPLGEAADVNERRIPTACHRAAKVVKEGEYCAEWRCASCDKLRVQCGDGMATMKPGSCSLADLTDDDLRWWEELMGIEKSGENIRESFRDAIEQDKGRRVGEEQMPFDPDDQLSMVSDRSDGEWDQYYVPGHTRKPTGRCGGCGVRETEERRMRPCGQCYNEWYCSVKCQGAMWISHKGTCRPRPPPERSYIIPGYTRKVADECDHCGLRVAQNEWLHPCGCCYNEWYCSIACQKAEWPWHHMSCRARPPRERVERHQQPEERAVQPTPKEEKAKAHQQALFADARRIVAKRKRDEAGEAGDAVHHDLCEGCDPEGETKSEAERAIEAKITAEVDNEGIEAVLTRYLATPPRE